MDQDFIGYKLEAFLTKYNLSHKFVEKATGVPDGTQRSWVEGTGLKFYRAAKLVQDFMNAYEARMAALEAQDGNADYATGKDRGLLVRISLSIYKLPLPYDEADVGAGNVITKDDHDDLIAFRIHAPFLGHLDGALKIVGKDLEPTYHEGQNVGIIRMLKPKIIAAGQPYLIIDSNLQLRFRRAHPEPDALRLVADNNNQDLYPAVILSLQDIKAVFKIVSLS